ncbi:MAG: response regulator, partial [Chloroflexi bacterium]|nr:response regulator [Chloroflexota bacterium]
FEKFYRVDNSDRRTIKGTGLGLAISRKLIEAHGGQIWAESAGLGNGARFCFSVPAIAAEMGEGDVLIIEDDLAFARLLSVELERLGLSAVRTPSAETALAQVGRARPRAVSLDLGLPDVPGERLLPQLRQEMGPSTPVLVVTVKDLAAADEQALMEHEVLAILRKGPATAGTAAGLIARALAPSHDFRPSAELLAS